MKITNQQHQAIISALQSRREAVVEERSRDANDSSSKWNNAREARAIRLDKERDDLDKLIQVLSRSSSIEW